jgi:hypothetical protein
MLWILDAGEFRQRSNRFKTVAEVQRAVLSAALNVDSVSKIQEMAAVNPKERASAAQMLVKYYNGVGLSTPRNQVPSLINSPVATTITRTPPPPALATRIPQAKPRLQNANVFAAAAQYRIEKARRPFPAQQAPRRLQDLRLKPARAEFS